MTTTKMEKMTRMEEVKKRQPLYLPGDPSTNVYFLKQGRVKISNTDASGKEITFELLEAGDVFGDWKRWTACRARRRQKHWTTR